MHIRRPQDIGALVRSARTAKSLNQQQLADRLGVSRWWVNELEGGKATARMDLVLRTLNELDITLAAYVSGETPSERIEDRPPPDLIDIDAIAGSNSRFGSEPSSNPATFRCICGYRPSTCSAPARRVSVPTSFIACLASSTSRRGS